MIKIHNQNLDYVTWDDSSACAFGVTSNMDVWRISVSANFSQIDYFLSVMSPAEVHKARRFYRAEDRNRFIVSHGGLRCILAKYLNQTANLIEFREGQNKKPYVFNPVTPALHYNLSHSGDWVLIAVSNSEVGIDVEFVNKKFRHQDVVGLNFNDDEIAFIIETGPVARFFLLWTRKEALIKATGQGLNDNLIQITCIDGTHLVQNSVMDSDDDWVVNSFKVDEIYIASVATSPKTGLIRFWDVKF